MTDLPSVENRSAWCDSVIEAVRPQSVMIVGGEAEEIVRCFAEKHVPAAAMSWDGSTPRPDSSTAWDVLILHTVSAAPLADMAETAFAARFGSPRVVLALFPFAENGPSLPEVSQWLARLGYSRALGEENWLGTQFFTAIYQKATAPTDQRIWQHEAEWWRLAQLSQKRRLLLTEYMNEMIETTFRYESQIVQLNTEQQNLITEQQRLIGEIERVTEWSRKLQQEVGQHEEWSGKLREELQKHEDWAKTLQNEIEQRGNVIRALEEENADLRQIKAQWDQFQQSKFGKLWKTVKKDQ